MLGVYGSSVVYSNVFEDNVRSHSLNRELAHLLWFWFLGLTETNNTMASNSTNGLATTDDVIFTIERRAEQSNPSCRRRVCSNQIINFVSICLPDRITGCIAEYAKFDFRSLPETFSRPLESRNG